jgi:hypothetical protein
VGYRCFGHRPADRPAPCALKQASCALTTHDAFTTRAAEKSDLRGGAAGCWGWVIRGGALRSVPQCQAALPEGEGEGVKVRGWRQGLRALAVAL